MNEIIVPDFLSSDDSLIDIPKFLKTSEEFIEIPSFLKQPFLIKLDLHATCNCLCMSCEGGGCEVHACQGGSEGWCTDCQGATCESLCQGCMEPCLNWCQNGCEGSDQACYSCMYSCQSWQNFGDCAGAACELSCQNYQDMPCSACMGPCQCPCQGCENCEGVACQTCECSTQNNMAPPAAMPTNIVTTYNGLNVTVTFTKGTNASYTKLVKLWANEEITYGTSFSFTLPAYGTDYNATLNSYNSDNVMGGYAWLNLRKDLAPPPGPPTNVTYTIDRVTLGRVTMYWTNGAGALRCIIQRSWALGEANYIYTANGATSYLITDFPIGSNEGMTIRSVNSEGSMSNWVSTGTFTINPAPVRPTNYYGSLYTVSGSNDVVSANEWKAFAGKVNEFRTYKSQGNFGFVQANNAAPTNDFTALHFNEMLQAMTPICAGLPNTKSPGDLVYKSYFNTLVSSLNNIV